MGFKSFKVSHIGSVSRCRPISEAAGLLPQVSLLDDLASNAAPVNSGAGCEVGAIEPLCPIAGRSQRLENPADFDVAGLLVGESDGVES